MAFLTVGPNGDYTTIRAALIAAQDGDIIAIDAGTYNITVADYNNSLAYSAVANCSTGFANGITSLLYLGAGSSLDRSSTTITGNARLFQKNLDGQAPIRIEYYFLDFLYDNGSGYLLQLGDAGASVASTLTDHLVLNKLSFRGTHSGNAGANGNYADARGIESFTLASSTVSLTGQAGFHGATGSGGSTFLLANGEEIAITNNTFDESGYRNAVSIFDSNNVLMFNNTFSRSTTRNVRSSGKNLKILLE